jgi:hypothetical protein
MDPRFAVGFKAVIEDTGGQHHASTDISASNGPAVSFHRCKLAAIPQQLQALEVSACGGFIALLVFVPM